MTVWGYSTTASPFVGQSVCAEDYDEAAKYGWQTLCIALTAQLLIVAIIAAAAQLIAAAFGSQ